MKTLDQIVRETDAMAKSKEDFTAQSIAMEMNDGLLVAKNGEVRELDPNDWALSQLFWRLKMPGKYFLKMYHHGEYELVADHTNHHLYNENRDWFVRTLQMGAGAHNRCRALLTERYSTFDNDLLIEVIDDFLGQAGADYEIKRWQLTDKVMRLFVTYEPLEVNAGQTTDGDDDVLRLGTFIQNSEVGYSSIHIKPMVYRQVCDNGLMAWSGNNGEQFEQRHTFSDVARVQREILYALNESLKKGEEFMHRYMETKNIEIENPAEVIQDIAQRFGHTKKFTEQAVESYSKEPGGTGYAVINAFTRAARNLTDDQRVEVEQDAGEMVRDIQRYAA